jgi:excinuclease UvrABC helicase subunit UvrB
MLEAAKNLDFDTAARLRDEWLLMEDKLQAMD